MVLRIVAAKPGRPKLDLRSRLGAVDDHLRLLLEAQVFIPIGLRRFQ